MLPKVVRPRAAVAALAVAGALSACSGSGSGSGEELDVDGFSPGACAEVAPTLKEIDGTLSEVEDEDTTPEQAGDRFKAAQDTLKPKGMSAAEPVRQAVTDLVTSLGFFRISVDSNNYDGSQIGDVREQLEALADACRGS